MSILDRIVEDTRALVAQRKLSCPIEELQARAGYAAERRSLSGALGGEHLGIIAEIKRASPSKGLIREDFEPVAIAQSYTQHGAQAISVLTEPLHFQGDLAFLEAVRPHTTLPLLRKDFIIDPYQLHEARAYGADAVLLIATCLEANLLFDLHAEANALGLECLVEVYATEELERLDASQIKILGVNNRNLHTFEVDLNHSIETFRAFPSEVIKVSESGIADGEDLAFLHNHGADAVLIGETFMRAENPGQSLETMRADMQAALAAKSI